MRGMRSDGKNLADRVRTPALEAALLVMIAGYADAIGAVRARVPVADPPALLPGVLLGRRGARH